MFLNKLGGNMRNKVILFSTLLLVLVIGTLLVASLYFISATQTTATPSQSDSESPRQR